MSTVNAKRDATAVKMAARAANLQTSVQFVWAEKDFENKKALAIKIADLFELGGKEEFIRSIQNAPNAVAVDRIATNAMLKGEGMSTKRF